jgi:hypothetical protein
MINRSLSTAIDLKSSIEMWIEKLVNYSHLYIFRSHMFVTYNNHEVVRVDSKSRKYILLRYVEGVDRYRLWDSITYKLVINKDIIFVEDRMHMKENDNTLKDIITVQVENIHNHNVSNSYKFVPKHTE